MITCDSCGCSGKDVSLREFRGPERGGKFKEYHLCDVCDKEIYQQQHAILTNRLYATPQNRMTATERMAYSLSERNIWVSLWRVAAVATGIINLALYGLLVWAKLHH